jgi:hypothetical protein
MTRPSRAFSSSQWLKHWRMMGLASIRTIEAAASERLTMGPILPRFSLAGASGSIRVGLRFVPVFRLPHLY